MEKQRKRSEIEEQYKWDLRDMYPSLEAWKKDADEFNESLKDLDNDEDSFLSSAKALKDTLDDVYEKEALLEKIYVYAACQFSTDVNDSENQTIKSYATDLFEKFNAKTSYLFPGILSLDEKKIYDFYEEEPDLKNMKKFLDDYFVVKNIF